MTFVGWAQIIVFCFVVVLLTKPLGGYMTKVFTGESNVLSPVLRSSTASPASTRSRSSTGSPTLSR